MREYEIRVKLSHDKLINIVENLNNCSIIKTVDLIFNNDGKSFIRESMIYDKDNNKTNSIVIKKKIIDTKYISNIKYNYKYSISDEIDADKDGNTIKFIRIKKRFIYKVNDWSEIHISIIKSLDYNHDLSVIKSFKNKCFDLELHDAFNNSDFEIELEIEFDDEKSMNECDINDLLYSKFPFKVSNLYNITKKKYNLITKYAVSSVIELNRELFYNNIKPFTNDFLVTEKLDGIRVVFVIWEFVYYIKGDDYFVVDIETELNKCVFDCEMMKDTFYLFDVLMYNGKNITNNSFMERYAVLSEISGILPPNIKIKIFNEYEVNIVKELCVKSNDADVDGIILTSKYENYNNTKHYKWKPLTKMSIDFVAKLCPPYMRKTYPFNMQPHLKLIILCVSIDKNTAYSMGVQPFKFLNDKNTKYINVQFQPSRNKYSYLYFCTDKEASMLVNKVVEMTYNKKWNLLKIRNNNIYGNNFKYAELIWENYFQPLTETDLLLECNIDAYFNSQDNQFNGIRQYCNKTKYMIFEKITNMRKVNTVYDYGCGKGQDLNKYVKMGINSVLMVDGNNNNLFKLINKKHDMANKLKGLSINIEQMDLCIDYDKHLKRISDMNYPVADLIVCNFSIHFFCYNKNATNNFCNFLQKSATKGSILLIMYFDGCEIFEYLKNNGQHKYIVPDFTIKKNTPFTGNDQYINIQLPFTQSQREALINPVKLNAVLKKNKFTLLEHNKITELNTDLSKLNDIELEFIKFICYSLFII